jgi:hypothetical protein
MSKNLLNHKTAHKFRDVFAIAGTGRRAKSVCTSTQAMELLDELRKGYHRLPPEQRKQVKAFMCELSCAANS